MEIIEYKQEYESALLTAIKKDPNWDIFTNDGTISNYRNSLKRSITYICLENYEFCGYVRAILDDSFAIYISELYVMPKWRNRKIGRSLLERVKRDFSNLSIYALSDEDAFYKKIGYSKIGSVFEL